MSAGRQTDVIDHDTNCTMNLKLYMNRLPGQSDHHGSPLFLVAVLIIVIIVLLFCSCSGLLGWLLLLLLVLVLGLGLFGQGLFQDLQDFFIRNLLIGLDLAQIQCRGSSYTLDSVLSDG